MTTKQSLNGHYCLATKEHYEQLVTDGYILGLGACELDLSKHDRLNISDSSIWPVHHKNTYAHSGVPMHYYNGQWVFGSLEHEEELCEGWIDVMRLNNKLCECDNLTLSPMAFIRRQSIFFSGKELERDGLKDDHHYIREHDYLGVLEDAKRVFGFEHGETKESIQEYIQVFLENSKQTPVPPKRITKEEFKDMIMPHGWTMENIIREMDIDELFDYIEYLEANQKDK